MFKLHKPKELLIQIHCFASIGFCFANSAKTDMVPPPIVNINAVVYVRVKFCNAFDYSS